MSQQKLDTWELIKLMFRKEFSRIKGKYTRILSDFAIRILLIFVKPAVKITSRFLPWILPVARFYGRLSSTKKIFVSISIVLFLFFIIVPKNTFIYEYVYRVLTLPGTALWAWWHSNLSTYAIVSKLVNTYLAERGFTLYNSFAWWAFSATLICPLLFYWVVWNYSFWLVKIDGSVIGRPFAYAETDFEEKYETDFEDLFHYGLFWIQNIMMVRYIFSYVEQVDKRANFDKYYYKYAQFKIRYGLWNQPVGRKEAFEHWYRALLSVRHVGYKKQVFSPQDVVIFNKVWRNKAYLLTNGFSYGSWMQYVKHNPKTGRPDMRKEPIFGQTEAFYTALHQAEYWGLCYFAYFNVDNLRFPIRDYIWSTKLNDPQYYDWVNKEVCIKNWYRYDKNGYKIPSNHVNNYYERYYPQAYAESWGVPWLFGIDTHRLTEYTHPPIAKVVESHALYRALCIKNGWSFDYLDFYPEYFIQTSLEDSESWFYPYGTGSNPSLFNDMFMFAWMLCQPDYEPGPFTARDLDFKLHLHFDLPRYSVSPASAVHDSTGDVLEMYRHLIGN